MKDKIMNIFQNIILILSFLLCIFVVGQRLVFKDSGIFGFRLFTIVTGSMSPELDIGEVILVKETNLDKLKKGNLITYRGMSGDYKDKIVTHKIVDIKEENNQKIFYTKGIKNLSEDPAVYGEQVYGKVIYKPLILSLLSKIVRNKFGFILLILIPLIAILIYEMISLRKEIKEDKDNKKEIKKEYEEKKQVVKEIKEEKEREKFEDKKFKEILKREETKKKKEEDSKSKNDEKKKDKKTEKSKKETKSSLKKEKNKVEKKKTTKKSVKKEDKRKTSKVEVKKIETALVSPPRKILEETKEEYLERIRKKEEIKKREEKAKTTVSKKK